MNISILGNSFIKEILELDPNFNINKCFFNTSLISLAKNPVYLENNSILKKIPINLFNDFQKIIYTDYEVLENEFLIINFLDECLDLIEVENSIITKSQELVNSNIINLNEHRIIERVSLDFDLWKEAADIFISEISQKYHTKNLILYKKILNEDFIRDKNIPIFNNLDKINEFNNTLEKYYDYIIKNMPGINVIESKEYSSNNVDYYNSEVLNEIKYIINNRYIFKNEKVYKSIKPIRYIFNEALLKNKEKLIISFSAFSPKKEPTYNFMRLLEKYDCNKLFILDDYAKRGTYYTGCYGKYDVEVSVMALISSIMSKYNINFKDVIVLGSSKGGTAALYYGTKYNFGTIISAVFQYNFATFLSEYSDKEVSTMLFGEIKPSNLMRYDNIIRKCLNKNNNSEIYIATGIGDEQYKKFLLPALNYMDNNNIKYNLKLYDFIGHNGIIEYLPEFISSVLDEKLKSIFDVIYDKVSKKLIVKLGNRQLMTAFYLLESSKKLEEIPYGIYNEVSFNITKNGVYRVDLFIMNGDERKAFIGKNIEIADI